MPNWRAKTKDIKNPNDFFQNGGGRQDGVKAFKTKTYCVRFTRSFEILFFTIFYCKIRKQPKTTSKDLLKIIHNK
jgi:hypothetical protein